MKTYSKVKQCEELRADQKHKAADADIQQQL